MNIHIENRKVEFEIDTRFYNQAVIFKTAYMYIDKYYVSFEYVDAFKIKAIMELKVDDTADGLQTVAKMFTNDLLAQKIRYDIGKETKNIRELILGRALYSTCLEIDEMVGKSEKKDTLETTGKVDETSIEDIAVNWFEGRIEEGE